MKKKNIYILILALIGLVITIHLSVIFYQSNYNPYAVPSFCAINNVINCDAVAQTTYSVFLGIPLSYWGMGFYLFTILLLFAPKLSTYKKLNILSVFKKPISYISILGLISIITSITLACISIFEINKICILCWASYIINFIITLIALDYNLKNILPSLKTSVDDFISGIKIYYLPFITVVLTATIFLAFTTIKMPFASKNQSIKHYMEMKTNPYAVSGNILGNKNGTKKIHLYADFNCPICPTYNIMLHKLVKENSDIEVIHHNFPLDTECNKYLKQQMHNGSCRMARYAIAAENQGKYWDMANALFENKVQNDKDAIKLAITLNLDIKQFTNDINSKETKQRIQEEINNGVKENVDGTPTLIYKDRTLHGAKPYYELKSIILEN